MIGALKFNMMDIIRKNGKHIVTLACMLFICACKGDSKGEVLVESGKSQKINENKMDSINSYKNDVAFLKKYMEIIELSTEGGQGKVAIAPSLQGRVMTSSAKADDGQGFGWLNYDLIASGQIQEHFNPVGGEERFWLGPEGGQFSIYFKPGTSFGFENWYVPKELDTEPFDVTAKDNDQISFGRRMNLLNYSGHTFNLDVERTVRILNRDKVAEIFGISLENEIDMVGFETENKLTNIGEGTWNERTGMLSIWILSMFRPSDSTYIILPYKKGSESQLGRILTDYEFNGDPIPASRLTILEEKGVVLFKADGKSRGKVGISQKRALPMAASYDLRNNILTLAYFTLPEEEKGYVNSLWKLQDKPFAGDVVNSYNDGPLEDGSQLGPFYEIESSSPAAGLKKNESLIHVHGTVHLQGERKKLEKVINRLFGLELNDIRT